MNGIVKTSGALVLAAFVAGCGADGEPIRPTAGVTVRGGTGGISTSATVGVVKGPVRVTLGF